MQTGSSVRVHRRKLYLDQALWTLLSPRPSESARFSSTPSDDGIAILADLAGTELLAHLLWALAFQDHERTAILLDIPFLVADRGEASTVPIMLVNAGLGVPSAPLLEELKPQLPLLTPSEGTVRLRTAGLDRARANPKAFEAKEREDADAAPWATRQWPEWMTQHAGIAMFAAPAPVLRFFAVAAAEFGSFSWESLDTTESTLPVDELHRFDRTVVKRAAQLRDLREVLFPGRAQADLLGPERDQLWADTRPT